MRRAAKSDLNQPEVVRALRLAGASVTHTHNVAGGFPDIVAGFRGETYLIEIKQPGGALTPSQQVWHDEWRGSAYVVESAEDALRVIGAVKEGSPA